MFSLRGRRLAWNVFLGLRDRKPWTVFKAPGTGLTNLEKYFIAVFLIRAYLVAKDDSTTDVSKTRSSRAHCTSILSSVVELTESASFNDRDEILSSLWALLVKRVKSSNKVLPPLWPLNFLNCIFCFNVPEFHLALWVKASHVCCSGVKVLKVYLWQECFP